MSDEIVMETRISTTMRGAVFRLRRMFYANVNNQKADLERSRKEWRQFIAKIIDISSKKNIADKPCKIILRCVEKTSRDKKYITPVKAKIIVYEKKTEINVE